ncbi:MAG: exopolysaccharide biosynthesis protein [Candidatus Methylacidiphilales bacterium]|nr:exopolysaccharide biosynthesis protein [Candidatus Methylacidiphilales bacterium]
MESPLPNAPVILGGQRLSAQVRALAAACKEGDVTLGEVSRLLQGRGMCLFLVVLALPFCLPVPMPGLSTPFGFAIMILGFRSLFRQSENLPGVIAGHRVSPRIFGPLLRSVAGVLSMLETLMGSRLHWIMDHEPGRRVAGGMIAICGFLLMLPLPIPFTNVFPAFTVVLLACAMVEHDGVTALVGLIFFLITVALFALIAWGGAAAVDWAIDWLVQSFRPRDEMAIPLPDLAAPGP